MKKHLYILLILLLFFSEAFSQKQKHIDSLKVILLNAKEDSLKVLVLNQISRKFYSINPDSTELYARDALRKSVEINYNFGKAKSYRMIGLSYLARSEYNSALKYLFLSLDELKKTKRISEFATVYTSIGVVYRQKSDYTTALEYYLKTLRIVKTINDSSRMSPAYNNIGVVYKNLKDYDKALFYYKKSLDIKKKLNDRKSIAYTLGNIGVIYLEKKQYDEAEKYILQVLKMFLDLGSKNETANSYMQLGKIYMFQKNYNKAIENINQSIDIYEKIGDKFGLADACLIKGNIYLAIKSFNSSKTFFKKGLIISKNIESKELEMDSYLYLSKLDSITGNYKSALKNHYNYINLKDSIFSTKNKNSIVEMKARYDISEKEQENILLRKNREFNKIKLQKQKTLTNFIWTFSALLFLIVFLVAFSWLKQKKTNKLLNQKNDEILAQNITLEEQKEKILSQYEEISVQNEELEKYKNHLQSLVYKKTIKLNDALIEVRKSDSLKTEFLMNLSHEIRTPINAILGFSEIFLNKKDDFKIEYIASVQRSMDALLNTINRLVIFSKYQIGEYKIQNRAINLYDFFTNMEEHVLKRRGFLNKENINTKFDIKYSTLPQYFETDHEVLQNVMYELIDNAFKFTAKGTLTIKANFSTEKKLHISVKDTGIGIKKEIIDYVFDFSRKFSTKNELYRGMGVGLALVKKGVQILSGDIKTNSVSNEGAEFIIVIPEIKE